ncbi:MAG: M12 family metallopeptidase [Polyangiales bacterium]
MRARSLTVLLTGIVGCSSPGSTGDPSGAGASTAADDGYPSLGVATIRTPWGDQQVAYRRIGNVLYAGLDERVGEIGADLPRHMSPEGVVATSRAWSATSGIPQVPYTINTSGLTSSQQTFVSDAIATWNESGSVHLYARTSETNYVYFTTGTTDIPSTSVGLTSSGAQNVSVGAAVRDGGVDDPASMQFFLHQIGHVLGMFHEEQRSDRNYFVQFAQTIIPSDASSTIVSGISGAPSATSFGTYNFQSIMELASTAQEAADSDGNEWIALRKIDGTLIKQGTALSLGDLFAITAMYNPDSSNVGDVMVALSTGSEVVANNKPIPGGDGFAPAMKVANLFGLTNEIKFVADFNGDGFGDLITFQHGAGGNYGVYVALSDGGGYENNNTNVNTNTCLTGETCQVADMNNDGKVDIVSISSTATWWTKSTSSSAGWTPPTPTTAPVNNVSAASGANIGAGCTSGNVCFMVDVNHDGVGDLIQLPTSGSGGILAYECTSTISGGVPTVVAFNYSTYTCASGSTEYLVYITQSITTPKYQFADLDGDGYTDLVIVDASTGSVYSATNTTLAGNPYLTTYFTTVSQPVLSSFCTSTYDLCLVGDMTGDGVGDIIRLRTSDNTGVVAHGLLNPSSGNMTVSFVIDSSLTNNPTGGIGEMPLAGFAKSSQDFALGDMNGDRKMDVFKFNNSLTSAP